MPSRVDSTGPRASATELSFVVLRVAVSAVLLWGASTKLAGGGERLGELAQTWSAAGLPQAQLLVTLSIAAQLVLALLLLIGLFARAAGLLNGVNFAAAAAVSGVFAGSNWWPIALLVVLLLHFGMLGGGRLSIDALRSRRLAAGPPLAERPLEELLASMGIEPQAGDGNYPGQSSR
ncbi:DoxX family membrane protein [Allosphingosinicella sp.]|jgi:uncharacterized membrane protein YphA (DoxX/SURF4 family)|uniref:DoxX family membrane protein n=1 Tax=Allosphingosinicella sp. TaxID=2823234 RepID=UPI002F256C72